MSMSTNSLEEGVVSLLERGSNGLQLPHARRPVNLGRRADLKILPGIIETN